MTIGVIIWFKQNLMAKRLVVQQGRKDQRALKTFSLFLGIAQREECPYLCKRFKVKATDKRETVIAHNFPAKR